MFRCIQSKQKLSTARYEYLKARNSAKRLKLQEEVENIDTCKLNDNYDEDNQEVCPCAMKLVKHEAVDLAMGKKRKRGPKKELEAVKL